MSGVGLLTGLRVVEGSAFVAAPSGGMTLAQLGADVIRFDQIGGGLDYGRWPLTAEGHSLYWAGLNKGKKSITVDLRSPEAHELLTALICQPSPDAGIFLTNFPARGWMGYERLRARRADLVMVNVLGNHDGTSALDYTVNCSVGYPLVTGPSDYAGPINHVLPAWDFLCGQHAALSILAADRYRSRSGSGQLVNLALSDIALWAVSALGHIAEYQTSGRERPRVGNDLYGAFGRDFATADQRRVIAVAVTAAQWKALVAATDSAAQMARIAADRGVDLASEGGRWAATDDIARVVGTWCSARPLAEIKRVFDEHAVCWGAYQSFAQLVDEDPRCSTANPLFSSIDQPGIGEVLAAGSPSLATELGRVAVGPAPRLGEHTDYVLADILGLSSTEIASLHDRNVVR